MDESEQDKERQTRPPQEGVRIIGAEEAAAALEKGEAEGRRPEDAPRYGDVPPAPSGPRLVHRFPLPDSADPTVAMPKAVPLREPPANEPGRDQPGLFGEPEPAATAAAGAAHRPGDDGGAEGDEGAPAAGSPPDLSVPDEGLNVAVDSSPDLPHWTEPPTGEVPRVLAGDDDAGWSAFGSRGLRWRDSQEDWDDDDLDAAALVDDGDVRVGALDESRTEHSDLYDFDEPSPSGPTPVPVVDPVGDETAPTRIRTRVRLRESRHRPPPRPTDDDGAGGGGFNQAEMGVRILVAGLLLVVAFAAFAWGTATTAVLATIVVTACAFELFTVLRRAGYLPAIPIGLLSTVSLMAGTYWKGERAVPLVFALTLVTTMLWYLLGVVRARPTINVMVTMGAFTWVAGLGCFATLMLVSLPLHHGIGLLMGPVLITVGCDVGSLIAGRYAGRHPLMPEISPNKTWEGVAGGLTGALFISLFVAHIHPWNSYQDALFLGLVVGIVAPLGDLCESMVKRDLSLKDMSAILPGHGGVLDRFDGMLFVLPAAYYLAMYLNIH